MDTRLLELPSGAVASNAVASGTVASDTIASHTVASDTIASHTVASDASEKDDCDSGPALTMDEMQAHYKKLVQGTEAAHAQATATREQATAAHVAAMKLLSRTLCMQVGIHRKRNPNPRDNRILFMVHYCKMMDTEEFRDFLKTQGTNVSVDTGGKKKVYIHITLNENLEIFDFFTMFQKCVPGVMPVLDF
jgi:hypothetical protein